MSRRHDRAFTDTWDLYKPFASVGDITDKNFKGKTYPITPTYAGVLGRLEPNREVSQPGTVGRSQQDTRIATDSIRLDMTQECSDTWYAQLKTSGHPEVNTWFIILGMAENMNWKAKTRVFYVKRNLKPPHRISAATGAAIDSPVAN